MLDRFTELLPDAVQQHISNTLWAVGTMGLLMPAQQLRACLEQFMQLLQSANPQDIKDVLWAVATMQQLQPGLGQLVLAGHEVTALVDAFTQKVHKAKAQEAANTLWACSELRYYPEELLSALEQQPQLLHRWLQAATAIAISGFAHACASLGYSSQLLLDALLEHAVSMQSGWDAWGLANLCWAAAVLDMQHNSSQVLQSARACSAACGRMQTTGHQQLYQVHRWLQQSRAPEGISTVLTAEQLQQCRDSWRQQFRREAAARGSLMQKEVFSYLQQLPTSSWQQPPVMEQLTDDGDASIDIGAVTASGARLAIEVDGPSHFLQPGNRLDGPTQARNRMLGALGYTVVSLPHFEWEPLQTKKQKQQYLLGKIRAAEQAAAAAGAAAGLAAAAVTPAAAAASPVGAARRRRRQAPPQD